jgi:hypothetical protein
VREREKIGFKIHQHEWLYSKTTNIKFRILNKRGCIWASEILESKGRISWMGIKEVDEINLSTPYHKIMPR